jgi:hypothetical protein
MTGSMYKLRKAVLLATGMLLLCLTSLASTHHCSPLASRESSWSCVQQHRIARLEPLLLSLIQHPSNLAGPTVQGYVQHRLHSTAADLLLFASLQTDPQTNIFIKDMLADDQLYVLHTPASAEQPDPPKPSRLRQLLQLAGTFTDVTLDGNRLTRTSISKTRVYNPETSDQFVSNSYESSTRPFTEEALRLMAAITPSLMDTSSELFGDDLTLSDQGAGFLPYAANSVQGSGSGGAQVPVAATAGQQPQQQQMEPLQPTLRIVGGVEAPTDR